MWGEDDSQMPKDIISIVARKIMLNEPLSQYEKDAYQNDIDSPSVSFTLFGAYRDNSATSLFLRETICKDPHLAVSLAILIDKCKQDDTFISACRDPRAAYDYFRHVTRDYSDEIMEAVKGTEFESKCLQVLAGIEKDKII
jgi:hypothetical protein